MKKLSNFLYSKLLKINSSTSKTESNRQTPVVNLVMEPTAPFSLLNSFWQTQLQIIEESELDFKNFALPLARIKKVMKVDEDVKPMVIHFDKQTFQFRF